MDGRFETEFDRSELIALVRELRRELKTAHERIASLEQRVEELSKRCPTTRLDESYSLKAEERRREKHLNRKRRQKSLRRGRRTTREKLDRAERTEVVCPEGFSVDECKLHRERPVWRIENGRAVLVAYEIYRGPSGEIPTIPGLLPRSEYGLEVHVTLAFLVFIVGLSMDKVVALLKFFWELDLPKSQADALLNRLARDWQGEFDALCQLLAVSAVVHADETSWSRPPLCGGARSVWAMLSEKARVLIFGCRKDAATLETLLPKESFDGVLVSDDAAVYRGFSKSQKCWAHLIRKAIRLTLLEPDNTEYRCFLDGLLKVYRNACRFAADKRLGESGRLLKVDELFNQMCELCGDRFIDESEPTTEAGRIIAIWYRNWFVCWAMRNCSHSCFIPPRAERTTKPNEHCAARRWIAAPAAPAKRSAARGDGRFWSACWNRCDCTWPTSLCPASCKKSPLGPPTDPACSAAC
ncbi:MAG: transposase [Planctomycetes bacterium]|nr:transposase [Planctomycetota bacterium]